MFGPTLKLCLEKWIRIVKKDCKLTCLDKILYSVDIFDTGFKKFERDMFQNQKVLLTDYECVCVYVTFGIFSETYIS